LHLLLLHLLLLHLLLLLLALLLVLLSGVILLASLPAAIVGVAAVLFTRTLALILSQCLSADAQTQQAYTCQMPDA